MLRDRNEFEMMVMMAISVLLTIIIMTMMITSRVEEQENGGGQIGGGGGRRRRNEIEKGQKMCPLRRSNDKSNKPVSGFWRVARQKEEEESRKHERMEE